jgi:NAD(P)-dependent dehydrogenase (short-subunit alcohol dehydrogenase family)
MQDKPVGLVTGGQQRNSRQIAKNLAAHGFTVLDGSRNLERREMAAKSVGADARAPFGSRSRIRAPCSRGRAHPERTRPSRRAVDNAGAIDNSASSGGGDHRTTHRQGRP